MVGNVGTYDDGVVGLARLNPGGKLDTSFGSGGTVTTTIGSGASYAHFGSMALQSDGKIVVSGGAGPNDPTSSNPRAFVVARYLSNGSLDRGFGAGGIVTTLLKANSWQRAQAVLVQPSDGKIVAAGNISDNTGTDWGLVRYNLDGSLDTSFGSAGIVTTEISGTNDYIRGAAIGTDGNIVVAGDAGGSFAVGRYLIRSTTINGVTYAAGSLDPTFGSNGVTTTSVGPNSDGGQGIAIQPDGKIVVAGYAQVGSYNQFVVLRYLSAAPLQAASAAPNPSAALLTDSQVQPLLSEALARWQAAGADVSGLGNLDIRIADLGGTTLGLASGNTIWLDANAAGWGWFVDPTPWDDSEFITPGDQGEQNHMDLLTALAHEIGHLLDKDHEEHGVMFDTRAAGIGGMPVSSEVNDWSAILDVLVSERLSKRRW